MAKAVSLTNANLKDLPVMITKGGVVTVPLAGNAQTPTGLDYPAAAMVVSGGQSDDASYCVSVSAQANTVAIEAIVIEAFAATASLSGAVRIQRIEITAPGIQTAAGVRVLQVIRTTTVGTGSAVTPTVLDSADVAYPGIARAKPTAGTETTVLFEIPLFVPTAIAAFVPIIVDFSGVADLKSPVIPTGVANGIALKDPGAAGGSGFAARIWFTTV